MQGSVLVAVGETASESVRQATGMECKGNTTHK